MSIESNRNGYLLFRAEAPGEKIFLSNDTSRRDLTFLKSNSLRSKRFQSSYCAKVGARLKKNGRGGGGSYTNFDNFLGGEGLLRRLEFQ